MKQDIDTRRGDRLVHEENGECFIKFFGIKYSHPNLKEWFGFPVIVLGYGYGAIDVFTIVRRRKGWKKGPFICMIEQPQ